MKNIKLKDLLTEAKIKPWDSVTEKDIRNMYPVKDAQLVKIVKNAVKKRKTQGNIEIKDANFQRTIKTDINISLTKAIVVKLIDAGTRSITPSGTIYSGDTTKIEFNFQTKRYNFSDSPHRNNKWEFTIRASNGPSTYKEITVSKPQDVINYVNSIINDNKPNDIRQSTY
jgi:hypothetical protein